MTDFNNSGLTPPVGNSEIYHKLGVLEGKLDAVASQETRFRIETTAHLEGIEARLFHLEKWRWFVAGTSAAAAGVVTFLAHYWSVIQVIVETANVPPGK